MMNRMSFSETIVLFFLALIIFGPKKLPEIARTVGKYLNEFRRASNEFKAQIEQEIAHLEVEDKKKTTILPPSAPVQGTTSRAPSSSLADSSSAQSAAIEAPATLASTEESHPSSGNGSEPAVATEAVSAAEPVTSPTSQESHV
jgi:sec-independent protein translocase protein TatB